MTTTAQDSMRAMVAEVVAIRMAETFPNASVTKSATTSDCPMVNVKMASGDCFNITITRARS